MPTQVYKWALRVPGLCDHDRPHVLPCAVLSTAFINSFALIHMVSCEVDATISLILLRRGKKEEVRCISVIFIVHQTFKFNLKRDLETLGDLRFPPLQELSASVVPLHSSWLLGRVLDF